HGWANLQSVHLNLPFADDAEFGRLHAAIRLVLPILPALAASSPMIEGRLTGKLDNRLDVYRHNARRVPMVSGQVVPEAVFTRADYEREIFAPLYADIAPHDPEGTLQNEWLNARGAIARFDRGAIEIRVLDIQECPAADLAIVATIAKVLELLCGETWTPLAEQQSQTTAALAAHLWRAVDDAGDARIDDAGYLRQFGLQQDAASMREVWTHLVDAALEADSPHRAALGVILREGTLAKRIVRALAGAPQDRWRVVYGALCDCLRRGAMFLPDPLA
ncbi:MAG: hypothetical protein KDA41_04320, partial [Planctomycetales bacterium]|nr:hypothetical protein [Planctomycetales bacterium]